MKPNGWHGLGPSRKREVFWWLRLQGWQDYRKWRVLGELPGIWPRRRCSLDAEDGDRLVGGTSAGDTRPSKQDIHSNGSNFGDLRHANARDRPVSLWIVELKTVGFTVIVPLAVCRTSASWTPVRQVGEGLSSSRCFPFLQEEAGVDCKRDHDARAANKEAVMDLYLGRNIGSYIPWFRHVLFSIRSQAYIEESRLGVNTFFCSCGIWSVIDDEGAAADHFDVVGRVYQSSARFFIIWNNFRSP